MKPGTLFILGAVFIKDSTSLLCLTLSSANGKYICLFIDDKTPQIKNFLFSTRLDEILCTNA